MGGIDVSDLSVGCLRLDATDAAAGWWAKVQVPIGNLRESLQPYQSAAKAGGKKITVSFLEITAPNNPKVSCSRDESDDKFVYLIRLPSFFTMPMTVFSGLHTKTDKGPVITNESG